MFSFGPQPYFCVGGVFPLIPNILRGRWNADAVLSKMGGQYSIRRRLGSLVCRRQNAPFYAGIGESGLTRRGLEKSPCFMRAQDVHQVCTALSEIGGLNDAVRGGVKFERYLVFKSHRMDFDFLAVRKTD